MEQSMREGHTVRQNTATCWADLHSDTNAQTWTVEEKWTGYL